jgi:hypothetical protein
MFTAVAVLGAGTFVTLVLRRLKSDISQEKEFRAKLSGARGTFLQQNSPLA